ncbi:aspartate/glutamate racemase family protein [Anaerovorax sp. IOR16]|uniref:aspartate/glutamate racemase family protein n=1 Tax=Anaerovorax sp. IOR16 TaxID=2773458 RepID=UPI0019D2E6EF|nr:amino acid racemase [Anaerovorax sp. IOR16]
MKTIGILGGMGPLATADLYKKITINTIAKSDQEQLHIIIDSNTAIPDRTKCILTGCDSPIPEMSNSIKRLETAGADFLIMPCNTAHYFYHDLLKIASVPILNMLDLTVNAIKTKFGTSKTVGLLATDGTLQSKIYDHYFEKAEMKLIKPVNHQKKVMDFIYEGIKKNNLTIGTEGLFEAVQEMEALGASVFILGCTELSAATDYYTFDERFVDPLLVLAKESIVQAGGLIK